MIQVTVAGMIVDQKSQTPILLLHIPPLDKYLPVWIGQAEALSIDMALRKRRFERPLTHDLMVTIIDGLEGKVTKITITDLRDNTFFAKIYIERGQEVVGIDARPSDSIAVAIRTEAPIFVADEVVDLEKDHLLSFNEEATRRLFERGEAVFTAGQEQEGPGSEDAEDPSPDSPDESTGDSETEQDEP
jgi:bifunctional DNase/RNase